MPLADPFTIDVTEPAGCTGAAPSLVSLSPPDGGAATSRIPALTATFDGPIFPNAGVVTITGSLGTTLTYDLSTSPPDVSFNATRTEMTITPSTPFVSYEE